MKVLRDDCRTRLRGGFDLLQRIGVAEDRQIRDGFAYLRGELQRLDGQILSIGTNPTLAQLQLLQGILILLQGTSLYAGKLLRASNPRNAFEWFSPFAALFRKVVNGEKFPDDLVVFSSDWQYSMELRRMSMRGVSAGASVAPRTAWFIGYPAFESENPHVLPVVGHEIGHALWYRETCETILIDSVGDRLKNSSVRHGTSKETTLVKKHVLRQLEELFCDTVAALLFGPAFLYAFRYMLAPSGHSHGQRGNPGYPDVYERSIYLTKLAEKFGWTLPKEFSSVFLPATAGPEFSTVDGIVTDLQTRVTNVAVEKLGNVALDEFYSEEETQVVLQDLRRCVPCRSSVRVSSIINAGYLLRDGHADWSPEVQVPTEERQSLLADLVFKSLEMIQFRRHAENQSAS